MKFLKAYLRYTRHHYYGMLLVLPLFVFYEIGIWWIYKDSIHKIRNMVDVLIKFAIQYCGISTFFVVSVLVLLVFLIISRPRKEFLVFHWHYYFIMLAESLFLSLVFAFFIIKFFYVITCSVTEIEKSWQGLILSLGAGIYEEFLFRVLLFGGISLVFARLLKFDTFFAGFFAAMLTSSAFSLIHYLGVFGETFSAYSFLFRFFGGLFFCLIYQLRGFSVAVYTHAIYDILIVFCVIK